MNGFAAQLLVIVSLAADAAPVKLHRPVYTTIDAIERNVFCEWDETQWVTDIRLDQWIFWARQPGVAGWRSCGWCPWEDATLRYAGGWWYLEDKRGRWAVRAPVLIQTVTDYDRELADRRIEGLPRLFGSGGCRVTLSAECVR